MSDLSLLLVILFASLGSSLALLWWWFKPRFSGETSPVQDPHKDDKSKRSRLMAVPLVIPAEQSANRSQLADPKLHTYLFAIALSVYLLTRLVSIERFPITFFADEAASTVIAAELLENGMHYEGEFLPTYFLNVDKYSLSVTVYLQMIPALLFGKSVLVTRAVSAMIGLIGVLAISLILKQIFAFRYWWTGLLWLMLSPAWFMHSRTAFEAPMASSFFALFILFYLLYLYRSPNIFPLVVASAAVAFYTYNPARVIVAAAIILFAIIDREYHWANRSIFKRFWWVIALSLLPYIRFFFQHPFAASDQLLLLNSYWVRDVTIFQKIVQFLTEFTRGLNPLYWYFPHQQDLARHTMKGYGHILWVALPLAAWGLFIALRRRRVAAYRVVLIMLACAPLGGAIVETAVTRSMPVIMALTLLSAIGFSHLMGRFVSSERVSRLASIGITVIVLSITTAMTADALKNGPIWYSDYGLYGMQYGSPEVLKTIDQITQESPDQRVIASPLWANGTSMLARFFIQDLEPLWWGVVEDFLAEDYPFSSTDLFVMLPHEYEHAIANEKVANIDVERIIYYPDGKPGFYFGYVELKNPTQDSQTEG